MKNLIYQCWEGDYLQGCTAGQDNMRAYAERIGAEYLFEHNTGFGAHLGPRGYFYGTFKPVYDERFHEYDNVLYVDTDIFAVEGLEESIFDGFHHDLGICTEPAQPELRQKTAGKITSEGDERWAELVKSKWGFDVPRTDDGLVKVYNAGLVLYSNAGLRRVKERFMPFEEYRDVIDNSGVTKFYMDDQNYLHAQLNRLDWTELHNGWNSQVHWAQNKGGPRFINDTRTPETKFVHVQLAGADHNDADWHWTIVNRPVSEWAI